MQIADPNDCGVASDQKNAKVYTSKAIMGGTQKPMNI